MDRLKADRRRFEYREKTLFGFVGNAIALSRTGMQRTGKGLLPMLFNLLVSGNARREIMKARHALSVRALSNKQFGKRKARADRVKALRDTQLKGLSVAFDIQKAALDQRHEQDVAAQKQGWRELAKQRKELWDEWREEFAIKPRQTQRAGSGGDSRSQAPPRPKSQFVDATKLGKPAPRATEKFLGAGKPVARQRPQQPTPGDSPKPGYKQRRSAAERQADGSYKPRQRNVPKP
jgi:hypothetical protein